MKRSTFTWLARLGLASLGLAPLTACEAQLGNSWSSGAEEGAQGKTPINSDATGSSLAELKEQCAELGDEPVPGPSPVRRLTSAEYDLTASDILGVDSKKSDEFPPEGRALGFNGVAEAQSVTVLLVEAYQQVAQELAEEVSADHDALLGCAPAQSECVKGFIADFGALAYRRPLSEDEVAGLLTVFEWGRDELGVTDGIEMVLEVILQSPDFLYRPELGGEKVAPGVVKLTSHEMATRLSYFLLGSSPDQELRQAAADNALIEREQIAEQARRLLHSPRARDAFRSFHSQWLDLEAVGHIERDASLYDGYSPDIPKLFQRETESFIDHVIFEDDGSLLTLLTANYTMLNDKLAGFYGLSGADSSEFTPVDVDATRAGLLTQGSLLAHHAQPNQTSPVHRGKFVREAFFCQFPPAPPADLVIIPPELDPNLTTRERFAAHSEDSSCAGCHELMDPLGLAFEHFDPVGRYREEENGQAIDASGEIFSTDVDRTFYGPIELGQALAQSPQVATCITKQWLRYAHGRSETPRDACSLAAIGGDFEESNYNIQQMVLALTSTDAFLYREEVKP